MSRLMTGIAIVIGVASVANGVFMVLAPESWYWTVPGVPDRGPFNQHFVRDIGFVYLLIGGAFSYAAVYSRKRLQILLVPTLWLTCHAVFHIWEVVVGICSPASLIEDFAGVTLPALLAMWLVYHSFPERSA